MSKKRPEGRLKRFGRRVGRGIARPVGKIWRAETPVTNMIPVLAVAAVIGGGVVYDHFANYDKRLERRMMAEASAAYNIDDSEICNKKSDYFPANARCNYLLIQGGDSRKRFLAVFKNDVRLMKGLLEKMGCQVETVCSDTHTLEDLKEAYGALAARSDIDTETGLYFTGHGVKGIGGRVLLKFSDRKDTKDSGSKSSSSYAESALIDPETLNIVLEEMRGNVKMIFDNCYSLEDLVKGERIESSDEKTESYVASHVDASYFTLALAYTMAVRGNKYTIEQTTRHLATNDSSLPGAVRELIAENPYAFNTIKIKTAKKKRKQRGKINPKNFYSSLLEDTKKTSCPLPQKCYPDMMPPREYMCKR